jgi:hypothetical protein
MASHIGRRKFLASLGVVAAAWPLVARAAASDADDWIPQTFIRTVCRSPFGRFSRAGITP